MNISELFSKYKYIFGSLVLVGLGVAYYGYSILYANNINVDKYELKIRPETSYEQVLDELEKNKVIKNLSSFKQVASWMKYGSKVKDGRYLIKKGMSNRRLIAKLRSGDQDPINLTFNNVWNIQELAGKLSKELAYDSLTLLNEFLSAKTMETYKVTPESVMTLFIPNSYDMFWNISPDKLVKRMAEEADKFWTPEKLNKAKSKNLTKEQVYTLASIVERESNNKAERPTVAGVYLNRLNTGDKLRADPTVVFANGDYTLKRVLLKHLNIDSPYNTYMYAGLPPGPIFMPSTNSIEAVLNAEKHDYFFFCAKPGYNDEHVFAKTLEQHNVNADIYHKWLKSEGIK